MKKVPVFLLIFAIATLLLSTLWVQAAGTQSAHTWPLNLSPVNQTKTITVTADNGLGAVTTHHSITLTSSLALLGVTITGPVTSTLGTFPSPAFTAVVQPPTATQPITYQWQATAQLPVTHTNGFSDTVTFRWPVPHTYTILVTATNGIDTVTDSHQIVIYPAPPIPGCASFPIGIQAAARSAFPPGTGSGNDYPASGDFHPTSLQPLYLQFPNHMPDLPLAEAQEGYIFKLPNGNGSGNMIWLVWNNVINSSSSTLANSLVIPGNSTDYTNVGSGSVTPLYPFIVHGYVNPFDTLDLIMQPDDWVTINNGAVSSLDLRTQINDHILNGRELRLPVWDTIQVQGSNVYAHMVQFATFRLHGHNLSQGGGPSWLLVEFVRWETGICSVGQYPVGQVHISGPAMGTTNIAYDFTATVAPTMTNQPLTYTWEAMDQTPLTQTAGITDVINLNWSAPGVKVITVTAENLYRTVTAVHTTTIYGPAPLTSVQINGPVTSTLDSLLPPTFTAVAQPISATQPITYTWQASEQETVTHTNGITDTAVFPWSTLGPKSVIVTATNGFSTVTATHLITISQPLVSLSLTGPLTGFVETDYDFTAVISPTTANQPITYTWQAIGQPAITHTNGVTDTAVFNWLSSGQKMIAVTAANGLGIVTTTHPITISQPPAPEPIMAVSLTGPVTGLVTLPYSFTAVISPTIATQPITYTWQATDQIPIVQVDGTSNIVSFTWNLNGTKTITVSADNGVGVPVTAVHTITIEKVIIDEWPLIYLPFINKP